MKTATQTLHRLTALEAGRAWDAPVDDPRVLREFQTNDLTRFPWFYKQYAQELPRVALGAPTPIRTVRSRVGDATMTKPRT